MNEDIECEYKNKCTSFPSKCDGCKNNKGKKDYYVPKDWHYPYDWYEPLFKYPYRWCKFGEDR
jgi:hypothetical protein